MTVSAGSVRVGRCVYGRRAMELGITGKRAAVAAASSGLGLGSAKALAAEGAHGRHLRA